MDNVLALTAHTGTRLAEVAFLLLLLAGLWLIASRITIFRLGATVQAVVAGLALLVAGVLLIIATHWGHYGHP